jgi:hypothetical protein
MLQDTQCDPVQEDEPLGTQPTKEDLEKAEQIDDPGKAKKRGKKNQWGPNVTLRRSSRNADDGRTILDKAQEFKRKWNLESNAGINAKAQNHVSKALLVFVAKDLNAVGVDGNPQVLDRTIALDRQRSLDNHLGNNNKVCPNSTNSGVDLVDNGGARGDKDLTPPKNVDKSLADPFEAN